MFLDSFLCFVGGGNSKDRNAHETQPLTPFRKAFKGPVIAAGAFIKETAEQEIEKGAADMIAFGTRPPLLL